MPLIPPPCVIDGDSLAVGLSHVFTVCIEQAKIGITAASWDTVNHPVVGRLTVISLGSNPGPQDAEHLVHIRREIEGKAVWILPAARDRDLVVAIASEYGDLVVDSRDGGATPEHIHPSGAGYREIAYEIITKTHELGE